MDTELFYGDNLDLLRKKINDETIDLIYLDPPFNSNIDYNVIFKTGNFEDSPTQTKAFVDTWSWNLSTLELYHELLGTSLADMIESLYVHLSKTNMMAYLMMMAIRLLELHRVLKDTGSLYIHCDPTASHYLKIILDKIFDVKNFRNEIIWKRSSGHPLSIKKFESVTDTILVYGKSKNVFFNSVEIPLEQSTIDRDYRYQDKHGYYSTNVLTGGKGGSKEAYLPFNGTLPSKGRAWAPPRREKFPKWAQSILDSNYENMNQLEKCHALDKIGLIYWSKNNIPRYKQYLAENPTKYANSLWDDIKPLSSQSKERLGYPTQKPVLLLERIIKASSNEGDMILDPFCGCGTTIIAAYKLKRRCIGMDITHLAMGLLETRLYDEFHFKPRVVGVPQSLESAQDLWNRNPFQFEAWAVTRVKGIYPTQKTHDHGLDGIGRIGPQKQYKIGVSVKGGKNLNPSMVDELAGALEKINGNCGILITLHEPTKGMNLSALSYGLMKTQHDQTYPKIQIYTMTEYFKGNLVNLPSEVQF